MALLLVSCYCNQTNAQRSLIVRVSPAAEAGVAEALRAPGAETGSPALRAALGGVVRSRAHAWIGEEQLFVVDLADSLVGAAFLERAATWEGVQAQPNYRYTLDGARATGGRIARFDSLEHLVATGVPEAWRRTQGRAEVIVGVVDSGVWLEHPAFAGQFAINAAEDVNGNGVFDAADLDGIDADGNGFVDDVIGYDFVDRATVLFAGDYRARDPDPSDDPVPGAGRGHGTAVAGVLAARVGAPGTAVGVAPGARLLPLRAFGADGIGEDDDVVAAILYAVERGVDVLNLSFGDVYYSPVLAEAIDYAVRHGVIVVASAGNDGRVEPHYPSDYPGVLSVAWLTQDGRQRNGRAARGVGVDLGAPGSQVYTTLFRPDAPEPVLYGRQSGSSVAAPQVAGAAALLRSLRPDLTPAAVRDVLAASAEDIEAPGWDEGTGAGLLRADRALGLALPARVAIDAPEMDGGVTGTRAPVVVTALDPAFATLRVDVSPGVAEPFTWRALAPARDVPALRDTVAFWNLDGLSEDVYTLRLVVARRDGATVEDRVRVRVDQSAPRFALTRVEVGLVEGQWGLLADVEANEPVNAWLDVLAPAAAQVRSDRRARRHGLVWPNPHALSGTARVRVTVENAAGLRRDTVLTRVLPAQRATAPALTLEPLPIPAGYLLPTITDFDADGFGEVVLNESRDASLGDSLGFWEWQPDGFRRVHGLQATVLPRSTGDTDGDGRRELLTQVQRATLVLEAASPGSFPSQLRFADTTGLGSALDAATLSGALLASLDGDAQGELVGHNGESIRVLERRGTTFVEVARVSGRPEAPFAEPDFRVADLNRNGRPEVVAVDTGGGIHGIEATGDDRYAVAWTFATGEPSPRAVLDVGDVTGDGHADLLVVTTNAPGTRADREQEPLFATLRLLAFPGGQPAEVGALRFQAPAPAFLAVAAVRFDASSAASVVLAAAPNLYALRWEGSAFAVDAHWGEQDHAPAPTAVRTPAMAVGDADGDGLEEAYAAFSHGHMSVLRAGAGLLEPPTWTAAYARDDSTVVLRWAARSDSVDVRVAPVDGTGHTLVAAKDSLVYATRHGVDVSLRARLLGRVSPWGPVRRVIPRHPTRVVTVSRPLTDVLVFDADRALGETDLWVITAGEHRATAVLRLAPSRLRVTFAAPLQEGAPITVARLPDSTGAPVDARGLGVPAMAQERPRFALVGADVLDAGRVRLTFSRPLKSETVIADNFSVSVGQISRVEQVHPERVTLTIEGVNLGPTGLQVAIEVSGVRAVGGAELDPDGRSILLAAPAVSLADAFVYPNPVRASAADHLTIGGVPQEVEVLVFTSEGARVRMLRTEQSRGGLTWDLRDESGAAVPSGMYLIRVTAPGSDPVLLRAAILR